MARHRAVWATEDPAKLEELGEGSVLYDYVDQALVKRPWGWCHYGTNDVSAVHYPALVLTAVPKEKPKKRTRTTDGYPIGMTVDQINLERP